MKAIIGQTLVYTAANIVFRSAAMIALLVFPFILTPSAYGALSLIVTVTALVQLVVPLEVTQGLARYYGTAGSDERARYVAAAWWFTIAMLTLWSTASLLLAEPATAFMFGSAGFVPVFRWAVLLFAVNTLFYFLQSQCRWQFMAGAYVWLSFLFSICSLGLAILLGSTMARPLEGVVIGQAMGIAIPVTIGMILLRRSIFNRPTAAPIRRMLRFSLPLVPASLALFASIYAGRLLISAYATLRDVAVFTFASQIAAIASLATIGVQSSLTPYVMSHHADPDCPAVVARMAEAFTVIAVLLCLMLGLLAPPLIAWLAPPAYAEAGPLVPLLCPAAILLQMYIFWPGFLIGERTDQQLWISLAGGGATVAFNAVLIPLFGIVGAAVANLAGACWFLGLWRTFAERHYPVPIRWRPVAAIVAIYAAAVIGGWLIPVTGRAAVVARGIGFLVAAGCVLGIGPLSLGTISGFVRPFLRRDATAVPKA